MIFQFFKHYCQKYDLHTSCDATLSFHNFVDNIISQLQKENHKIFNQFYFIQNLKLKNIRKFFLVEIL